ncbi:hypothetical protein [Sorangium sp. So ce385]|uniref:hypothetical protein n=1 Tax=Sorangium sp. So ce385 TaxID=3133308 RepID=UPI003F5B7D8F
MKRAYAELQVDHLRCSLRRARATPACAILFNEFERLCDRRAIETPLARAACAAPRESMTGADAPRV